MRRTCYYKLQLLLGDVVSANPTISSGLPIPNEHRYPPPASRPENYSTPATKGVNMLAVSYSRHYTQASFDQLPTSPTIRTGNEMSDAHTHSCP